MAVRHVALVHSTMREAPNASSKGRPKLHTAYQALLATAPLTTTLLTTALLANTQLATTLLTTALLTMAPHTMALLSPCLPDRIGLAASGA